MAISVETFKSEPKKMWLKGVLITMTVFLSIEVYSRTKFKDRINMITNERFNIVLL